LNTIPGSKQLDSVSKETTPFNQIFGGYIRQEVTCLRCKHVSTTFQRFMDILVEIQQANTIEDALVQFFKQKRLGHAGDEASLYKCEKCKAFV
jgi:ubiquitin carboxyl-terminal hydrolase 36/42